MGSDCAVCGSPALSLALIALAIAVAGCARQPVMRIQMAAAPSPYGIDNVVYGSGPAPYGTVAPSPYRQPLPHPPMPWRPRRPMEWRRRPHMLRPRHPVTPHRLTDWSPHLAYGGDARRLSRHDGRLRPSPTPAKPAAVPYTLDSGDRLRVVVFGQDGLTNSYVLDASGHIAMPLIGTVPARGLTTDQLSQRIADMLRQGYVREPHVAVEVEAYRPFFILGEVTAPGQYPYVAEYDGRNGGGDRRRLRAARPA